MKAVNGVEDLEVRGYYIRNLIDPHVLIAGGGTGECFARKDGNVWEHVGYKDGGGKLVPASIKIDGNK